MLTPLTKYENVLTAVFIAVMMRTKFRPLKLKKGEGSINTARQMFSISVVFEA